MTEYAVLDRLADAAGLVPVSGTESVTGPMWSGRDGVEIGLSEGAGVWNVVTSDRGSHRDLGSFSDQGDAARFLALRMTMTARSAANQPALYVSGFAPGTHWTEEAEHGTLTWSGGKATFPRGIGGLNAARHFSWVTGATLDEIADRIKPGATAPARYRPDVSEEPTLAAQQRLTSAIAANLVQSVGAGVPARFIVRILTSTSEPELFDLRCEPPKRLLASWDALDLARELRSVMAVDGAGTWYTMRCELASTGAFDVFFDYDDEPAWGVPVDPVAYLTDLERYPRDNKNRPGWLRARLSEADSRRNR